MPSLLLGFFLSSPAIRGTATAASTGRTNGAAAANGAADAIPAALRPPGTAATPTDAAVAADAVPAAPRPTAVEPNSEGAVVDSSVVDRSPMNELAMLLPIFCTSPLAASISPPLPDAAPPPALPPVRLPEPILAKVPPNRLTAASSPAMRKKMSFTASARSPKLSMPSRKMLVKVSAKAV